MCSQALLLGWRKGESVRAENHVCACTLSKPMKEVTIRKELPHRPCGHRPCGGIDSSGPVPGWVEAEAQCLIDPSLLHPSIPGTGLGSRNSRQQENNSTDCGGADSLGTVGCHGNRRKLILGSGTYPLWSLGAPLKATSLLLSHHPSPLPFVTMLGCTGKC